MRRFLRFYPWPMEVVPATMFGVALVAALLCWLAPCHFTISAKNSEMHSVLNFLSAWSLLLVFAIWIQAVENTYRWARMEKRKRYNWNAIVQRSGLIVLVWQSIVFSSLGLTFVGSKLVDMKDLVRLLPWMIGFGLPLCALQELTRPFTNREVEPEPELPTSQRSKSLNYSEEQIDWFSVAIGIIMTCSGILSVFYKVFGLALIGLLGIIIYILNARFALNLTQDRLLLRTGLSRKRFCLSSIESCQVIDVEPSMVWRRKKKMQTYRRTSSRCVEIFMKDGVIVRFSAIRPNHICRLITSEIERM